MISAISVDFIIDVLKNKEAILQEIEEHIQTVLFYLQKEEDAEEIRAFCLPRPSAAWGEGRSSEGRVSDLSDLYEKYENSKRRRQREYRHLLEGLLAKREETEHIWNCFLVLPYAQHRLLHMYYVEGRKLEDVACELGISVKTAFNHRNTALKNLKACCESGLSPDVLLYAGRKTKDLMEH